MNAKKNARHDLERKRTTIFAIGLLAAGSFTLAAFTYRSPLAVEEAKIASGHTTVDYQVEQVTEQPKETPVSETSPQDQPEQSTINLMSTDIAEDIERTESSKDKVISNPDIGRVPYEFGKDDVKIIIRDVKPTVYDFPDEEAAWIGGEAKMYEFIKKNMDYPIEAQESGEQGKVYVFFVVQPDGSISDISAEGDVHRSLKAEARRIVKSFPKWKPGTVDGFDVPTRVRLPINFILQ